MLALLGDDHFFPLRLGFALARTCVTPPPLLFNALRLFHRPFELCSLIHGLWYVPTPDRSIDRVCFIQKKKGGTPREEVG